MGVLDHALRRLAERHGIHLTSQELAVVMQEILDDRWRMCGSRTNKLTGDRMPIYSVCIHGTWVQAVWCRKLKLIVTFAEKPE
jgi:hypothetical protein